MTRVRRAQLQLTPGEQAGVAEQLKSRDIRKVLLSQRWVLEPSC